MTRELPDWQPFDPAAGPVSTSTAPASPEQTGGRVVVLAPTASVEKDRWAARTAVALARAWSGEGTKVFLADLSVSRPVLHDVVGVENGEGVSDALLYGASIRRIAVSGDEPFFFAPAGTAVADAEPVLGHPRWEVLTQGFASAGVTLLLYAPLDLPGTRSLFQRASEVILLATEEEAAGTDLDGADGKVTLVLGPEGGVAPGAGTDGGDVPAQMPADAPGTEAEAAAPGTGEAAAPAPAAPRSKRKRKRKSRSSRIEVLVLVLVLVLGGAVLGAYYGYLDVPWLTPYLEQLDGGGEAAPGDAAPATTPPTSPEGGATGDASSTEP